MLEPHVIKVTSDNALANLFEVDTGYVVPVVFGGTATSATVEVGPLPIKQYSSTQSLQPVARSMKEWL